MTESVKQPRTKLEDTENPSGEYAGNSVQGGDVVAQDSYSEEAGGLDANHNPEGVSENRNDLTKIRTNRRTFLKGAASGLAVGVGGNLLYDGIKSFGQEVLEYGKLPELTGLRQPALEIQEHGFSTDSPITWIMGEHANNMTISAGSNNVRNKLLTGSEAGKVAQERSKATADVAEILAKMLERDTVEHIDNDIFIDRERASISVGSAIASKAFRDLLGWQTKQSRDGTKFWFEGKVPVVRPDSPGIFHDLSGVRLRLGERSFDQRVIHWPMAGRLQDLYTPRREIEVRDKNQLLMLTYVADTGEGNPHLNIAGKNACGTWASLYLCSPYLFSEPTHSALQDRLRAWIEDQKRAGNSFQVTFVFDDSEHRTWDFGEQVFPQKLLKVGIAVLDTDVSQGLKALGRG